MSQLQPYPEYKDSGIEWLGKLPSHWEVVPSKWLFGLRAERSAPDAVHLMASQKYGVISQAKFMAEKDQRVVQTIVGGENMKRICVNDFLIHLRSFQGGIEWSANEGKVSPAYTVLSPNKGVYPPFFYYLLKSDGYIQELRSTTNQLRDGQSMNYSQFAMVPLIQIPLDEQVAIANFLDSETAQIDDLIGKQERLIELLAEKRQAILTHAVTKGLDPDAPTKPSGVPWLGDIPATWSVSKLSRKTRGIGDGLHGTPKYSKHGSIPFINGTNLLGGEIRITESTNFVEEDQLSNTDKSLDESTVLISINGTIGNCAIVGNRKVMLSKSAAYIKCSDSLDVQFLAHYLRSTPTRSYFFATSGGTTIANLSLAALRGAPIPVPPLLIQQRITEWLDEQIQSLDELGSKAYEAAQLLRERRSALISAAVTGKIDVREGVA